MRISIIFLFLETNTPGIELPANATAMETDENNQEEIAAPLPSGSMATAPDMEIATKARAYLAKKREEITGVRAIFANRIATYDAIKVFNKRKSEALDLSGGSEWMTGHYGDFLSAGDGRMGSVNLTVNFGT